MTVDPKTRMSLFEWLRLPKPVRKWIDFEIAGHFDTFFLTVALSRSEVCELLPKGVSLCEVDEVPAKLRDDKEDQHPVILMLGIQRNLCPQLNAIPLKNPRTGVGKYHEAAVFVPYTEYRGSDVNRAVVLEISLNQWIPIVLGWLVGLPKRFNKVTMRCFRNTRPPREFQALDSEGKPGVTARLQSEKATVQAKTLPAFEECLLQALRQPLMGILFSKWFGERGIFCSEPEFFPDYVTATPVAMDVEVTPSFLKAGPRSFHVEPITPENPLGGVWLRKLRWEFPTPFPL